MLLGLGLLLVHSSLIGSIGISPLVVGPHVLPDEITIVSPSVLVDVHLSLHGEACETPVLL